MPSPSPQAKQQGLLARPSQPAHGAGADPGRVLGYTIRQVITYNACDANVVARRFLKEPLWISFPGY